MATFSMLKKGLSRREIHRAFEEIRPYITAKVSGETLENLKDRIRDGIVRKMDDV